MYSHWISLILMAAVLCAGVNSTPLRSHQHRREIPCNHPLRLVVPSLFSHCGICTYSDWTAWNITEQRIPTLQSICDSKLYYIRQRTRSVVGNRADCNEVNQTEKFCYPNNEERLILGLGLGGSEQKLDQPCESSGPPEHCEPSEPTGLPGPSGPLELRGRRQISANHCPPHSGSSGEVCKNLTASQRGKRSTSNYDDSRNKRHVKRPFISENNMLSEKDGSAPIPFDWNIHGSHFRQRRQTHCGNDDVQQILFVLDSSGSVGHENFNKMKVAIAKLVPLFCKQIKTALISFSSDINLEYCFNCFDNTYDGRSLTQTAIKNVQYLSGSTRTGATAKCICDHVLSSSCGINTTECLDVIFITDGHSNDPKLEVCDEIKCLHNQVGISTYAIGIGGYDYDELECIAYNSKDDGRFEFETFQEFEDSINKVIELVTNATIGGNLYSCSARDRSFSPTGSPFSG